jgi:(4S)-4-hydroxy-5-phosphonooxypentane-2,3-dione isomerase
MHVVIVHAHVKPEFIQAFKVATLDNASHSIKEPGIARFDVYQQNDEPTRFTLVEVYRSADDPPKHRQTAHYTRWRDTVADMMAEPRSRTENKVIYPPEE